MPKAVNSSKVTDKKKKEEEEKMEVESSEEESSDSDNSDSDSSDSSNSGSSSSDNDSDSSDSSDSSESEEEKPKEQKPKAKVPEKKEEKGKSKVPEVVIKGTKNKRTDEESSKEQTAVQPSQKKVKPTAESNGHAEKTNGHAKEEKKANGHSKEEKKSNGNNTEKATKEVEKWREENQLTVVNIEDSSVDPTAPYAKFDDAPFPEYVKKSTKDFKFEKPTPIQSQAWPLIGAGRDIVGIAETGSGKTLAFGYHAIIKIKNLAKSVKGPKALMLAPTRELAQQIHEVLEKACVPAQLNACCVFGGVEKGPQARKVAVADIVVATPGRLIDLLEDGSADLTHVNYLVFDEADRMLDMGFIPQIRAIVSRIPKGNDRQTLMFSATWPVDVQKFAHTYLRNPIQITIGKAGGDKLAGAKKVTQIVEVCAGEGQRRSKIKQILKRLCDSEDRPRILLFMLYKNTCDSMFEELKRERYNVDILHGGKTQALRDKAVSNFKTGVCHILIATDVAARGLDIKNIKYVINGELPLVMEDYIHRIGRTGRAGESGSAYTVFSPDDKVHARQLVRILEEGQHKVPAELAKIAETAPVTKPRKTSMETLYGDYAKGVDLEQMMKKPTKITFD